MNLSRRTFLSTIPTVFGINKILASQNIYNSKSVVWLWLGGGASSTELTNPIPDAPIEYRGINGFVNTRSNYQIGGNFPLLANLSNKYTTVRSLCHKDNNHGSATNWLMVGSPIVSGEGIPQSEPSHGSVVAYKFGENNRYGIPSYTKLHRIQYDDSVWLGSKYSGFNNTVESVSSLKSIVEKERLDKRLEIVKRLDKNLPCDWSTIRDIADNVLHGTAASTFDISLENEDEKKKYNIDKSELGKSLLLTKRLLNAGSKFITIHYGGWDLHWNIASETKNLANQLDLHLSSFISDLSETGQLDDTLIVVTTEFGRTPKLNDGHPALTDGKGLPGRDHWAFTVPLILIGGNYQTGAVIGETDKFNGQVISNNYHPEDLRYSILNHFGIDKNYIIIDEQNRPHHVISDSSRIILA